MPIDQYRYHRGTWLLAALSGLASLLCVSPEASGGEPPAREVDRRAAVLADAGIRTFTGIVRQSSLKDSVNVRDLGATGDGSADDTLAIRKAIATGKLVYFPAGEYLVTDRISVERPLRLVGASPRTARIKFYKARDPLYGSTLVSSSPSGSLIASLGFTWGHVPWTVKWDYARHDWWKSRPTVSRTKSGYMPNRYHPPTVWNMKSYARMNHQQGIHVVLAQPGTAGSLASNIMIDNVYGEFFSIRLAGVRDSLVQHCHFVGTAPATTGGIDIWNYGSNQAGLKRGSNITVQNNRIENCATNGINLAGVDDSLVANNFVSRGGESAIKTYQSGPAPREDPDYQCHRIAVVGNWVEQMWDTGLDLTHTYPASDGSPRHLNVVGNTAWNNRIPGINISGSHSTLSSNHCYENGADGIRINGSRNLVSGNRCHDNNLAEHRTGRHEITVALGTQNSILFNRVYQSIVRGGNLGVYVPVGNVVVAP